MSQPHHVVIIGGGFAGLEAAKALKKAPVKVTLIDRNNYHLFQPLLYQVATGALSPADIASPLRAILRNQDNAQVLMAEVIGFDVANQRVILTDGELTFDSLILATGVRHHYFGNDQWESFAPGLKTVEDALEIRCRILSAFEAAERETDPEKRAALLTFVAVGAGPTGVELAGAIGEIAMYTLKRNFRSIDPSTAKIYLVEGTDRVLPSYVPRLSKTAAKDLEKLGVTVRLGTFVTNVEDDVVTFKTGDEIEQVRARTVMWCAGVKASPLGRALAEDAGTEVDRIGRVIVGPALHIDGYPNIFVVGDLAHIEQDGEILPGVANAAQQQGRYVARLIHKRLDGKPTQPFHYVHLGSMATIGRASAVADLGFVRFGGYIGWLAWLFVHLMKIVGFQRRILILIQWASNYITRNRSARLITHYMEEPPELVALAETEGALSNAS